MCTPVTRDDIHWCDDVTVSDVLCNTVLHTLCDDVTVCDECVHPYDDIHCVMMLLCLIYCVTVFFLRCQFGT